MWCKVSSIIIVLIAVVLAAIACSSFADQYQGYLLSVAKFFDVMLPILGVGALLKFLFTFGCGCCKKGSCNTSDESNTV